MLYRFGAVVLFGVGTEDRLALFRRLRSDAPAPEEPGDAADLRRAKEGEAEGADASGALILRALDVPSFRVVAEVLARSATLAYYESHLAVVLADLESPIVRLRLEGRLPARTRGLLRSVGEALDTEMRMVGRVEVSEKPEFLWDEPSQDRLYAKLADEYELTDRDRALSRKLDLVTRSVSILMEALSARRSLHVEWAIFALILAEIILLV
ncbi:MAG: RMD1 family protein [Myxococcales bacterium]|nr:RMD1 family protein [Myxococcales bacterium]